MGHHWEKGYLIPQVTRRTVAMELHRTGSCSARVALLPLPCTKCGRPRSCPEKAVTRPHRCEPSSLNSLRVSSSSSPQSSLLLLSPVDVGSWVCRGAMGTNAALPLGAPGGNAGDTSPAGRDGPPGSPAVLLLPTRGVVNVHHHSSVVAVDALLVGVRVSSTWRMGRMAPEVHIWVLLSEPISQTGQGQKK
jgi:hypothetical protein